MPKVQQLEMKDNDWAGVTGRQEMPSEEVFPSSIEEPKHPAPPRWYVCRKEYHLYYLPIQSCREIWIKSVSTLFVILCCERGAQHLRTDSTIEGGK